MFALVDSQALRLEPSERSGYCYWSAFALVAISHVDRQNLTVRGGPGFDCVRRIRQLVLSLLAYREVATIYGEFLDCKYVPDN